MTYWISVHHPSEIGESRESECQVWLQAKSRQRPKMHDRAFIYETEAFSRVKMPKKQHGIRQLVPLRNGAKGIIALVELSSREKPLNIIWNNTLYNGIYDTREIPIHKNVISLEEINQSYLKYKVGKTFTPHINTGLRKLKAKEIEVMCNLAGVKP